MDVAAAVRTGCPACGGTGTQTFYCVDEVPVHSVLLMETRQQAVSYPRGQIELRHCEKCGFVFNAVFDSLLQEFSGRYEETQGFSRTFRAFHRRLALDLIDRFDLRKKRILEIGCGKGEFLALLCELGDNAGVGFDPAFVPERNPAADHLDTMFRRELFPPGPGQLETAPPPDFVCCKMTLEHIPDVRRFVRDIRTSLVGTPNTVVFFQVPDAERVFRDVAFWDVYYEHCSYFTRTSLPNLFRSCGFRVVNTWTDYDGQYLMLTAVPTDPAAGALPSGLTRRGTQEGEPNRQLRGFGKRARSDATAWRDRIRTELDGGGRVCLWGAGSKAVSFLSAVGTDLVSCAVDINPHKQGTYLPGSGTRIVGPAGLPQEPPTLVIAMNHVYVEEIAADLRDMEIEAQLVALGT